jgi:hypothetical protein
MVTNASRSPGWNWEFVKKGLRIKIANNLHWNNFPKSPEESIEIWSRHASSNWCYKQHCC